METERLGLGRLTLRTPDDAPKLESKQTTPQVTKISLEPAQKRGTRPRAARPHGHRSYPNGDYYQWGIVEKATGQVFGSISVFTSSSAEPGAHPWPGFDHTNGVWEVGTASAGAGGTKALPPKPSMPL